MQQLTLFGDDNCPWADPEMRELIAKLARQMGDLAVAIDRATRA